MMMIIKTIFYSVFSVLVATQFSHEHHIVYGTAFFLMLMFCSYELLKHEKRGGY
ncbi:MULTISPECIES: hypothetical protein [Macrococcus]|nr:hypothetical protein [Macrococcus epidermidis]UTH16181.1 hypothetical protein KFV12_13165 [Macrococcus epidermidis]